MTAKTQILGRDDRPRRASLDKGVEWIALNDEPTCFDPEEISCYISTMLLADLFNKESIEVARMIVDTRCRIDKQSG